MTDVVHQAIVALGIEDEMIVDTAHLRDDLELDSTDLVELTLEIKRKLDVEITVELDDDPTVGDVRRLVKEASSAPVAT